MPKCVAPENALLMVPSIEKRPDMIPTPRNPTWELFLTGEEGYVGRDNITSGAMFLHSGQPLIQTWDLVEEGYDLIHHTEIKEIHKMFEAKKFPAEVCVAQKTFKIENSDPELYCQGKDEEGNYWTVMHTHKTVMIGMSDKEDVNPREMYTGMRRVADFFLISTY
jgi:hypothetical protein